MIEGRNVCFNNMNDNGGFPVAQEGESERERCFCIVSVAIRDIDFFEG